MALRMKNPPHPGFIVKDDLDGLDLDIKEAAEALDMGEQELSALCEGKINISPVIAWKLSKAFTNSDPEFWLRLQAKYDLSQVGEEVARNVKVLWNPPPLEDEEGNLIEENVKLLDKRAEKTKSKPKVVRKKSPTKKFAVAV